MSRHMNREQGFALPTVVIVSVVLFVVMLAAISSVSSIRGALLAQYYQQLAREAAESGAEFAANCLDANSNIVTWTVAKPLKPNTDCTGTEVVACTSMPHPAGCDVNSSTNMYSTFSVAPPSSANLFDYIVTVTATVNLVRSGTTTVWNNYSIAMRYDPVKKSQPAFPSVPTFGSSGVISAFSDGYLWGWGCNGSSQFGDGTTTNKLIPGRLIAMSDVVDIVSAAINSTSGTVTALKSNGSVWAWGYNADGQIGNGTTTTQSTPTQVISSGVVKIYPVKSASGVVHETVYALKSDGSLWAWGYNGSGQVGNNSTTNQLTPVQIIASGVSKVYATGYNVYVIKSDGSLWAWGSGTNGPVGNNSTTNQLTPVQIIASGVSSVITTWFGAYAIKSDGSLWAWGYNGAGQVGNNSTTNRLTPVQVIASGVSQMIASASSPYPARLVIKTDGSLWAWGSNTYGQVGNNSTTNQLTPVQIMASGVVKASANDLTTFAIKSDGSLWAWGWNTTYGTVGNNSTTNQLTPVQIMASGVTAAGADSYSAYALKSDGSLWIWGRNDGGVVGNGTLTTQLVPYQAISSGVTQISFSSTLVYALKSDGTAWAISNNTTACNLNGTNPSTYNPRIPVQIAIPPIIIKSRAY